MRESNWTTMMIIFLWRHKMTNAGKNILDDSLISPLQLTIKLEDAIKMLESPKKLLHQQVIFNDQCNSICTLE